MTNKPKIMTFDIETSHMLVAEFSLFNKAPINPDNIIHDWYMICACWKFLGNKKIYSTSVLDDKKRFNKDFRDDYHVVKSLHDALMEADMLVGHNIDQFDWKKFNTRCIKHGLTPVPKIRSADTLKMAKASFKFSSNKLDYIAQFLEVGRKVHTPRGLWLDVMKGDASAVRKMVKYCRGDVTINEDVYLKLRPWHNTHPNLSTMNDFNNNALHCPKCGSEDVQKRGFSRTNSGVFQRYQCKECHGWSRGRENLASKKHTGKAPASKYLTGQ